MRPAAIRSDLADSGIQPVIPRSSRKAPIDIIAKPTRYHREAYERRNLIERCVNRLKRFRGIATRYEKTAEAYLWTSRTRNSACIKAAVLTRRSLTRTGGRPGWVGTAVSERTILKLGRLPSGARFRGHRGHCLARAADVAAAGVEPASRHSRRAARSWRHSRRQRP